MEQSNFKMFSSKIEQSEQLNGNSSIMFAPKNISNIPNIENTELNTLLKKDDYIKEHSDRVAYYSKLIAKEMGFNEVEQDVVYMGALFHDIGKTGIDYDILHKEDRLTDNEFAHLKTHINIGTDMANKSSIFKNILPMINQHHERMDGKGYPSNLKGDEIDLNARIVSVADAFDAMTEDRPYRKGMSFELAIAELKKNAGTQFDKKVVDIFTNVIEKYM